MSLTAEIETVTCRCGRPIKSKRAAGSASNHKLPTACPACLRRERRKRDKLAEREDPELNQPAYLSDELELSEADRAGVVHLEGIMVHHEDGRVSRLPSTSLDELLRCVERRRGLAFDGDGRRRKAPEVAKGYEWDGILETAWALPLWHYRQVKERIAEIDALARQIAEQDRRERSFSADTVPA
jgi:hypothetical protein